MSFNIHCNSQYLCFAYIIKEALVSLSVVCLHICLGEYVRALLGHWFCISSDVPSLLAQVNLSDPHDVVPP